jgi:hypothetical protein
MTAAINQLLQRLLPDTEQCLLAAARLHQAYPNESNDQLARRVIQAARKRGIAIGAVTGSASNLLMMFPAAMADIAAMLSIEATLAGTIAAIYDPISLQDGSLRADVLAILFPGAVSQVLRQVGVRAGEQLGKGLLRKSLTENMLKKIVQLAGKRLGFEITRNAIVEKAVPLVGAGIGASWNWVEASMVGERAIAYYKNEPLMLPGTSAVKKIKSAAKGVVARVRRRES